MPKEISPNELIIRSGVAGKVLSKSLTKNRDYDGGYEGVPAGVSGEAALTSIKLTSSESPARDGLPAETWITMSVTGTITEPKEYKGRQIFPRYTYGKGALTDEEKASTTVKRLIQFMRNLGVPQAQIDKAKKAKAEQFIYTVYKTLEACCKAGVLFRFKISPQKNNPQYNVCLPLGPAHPEESPAPEAEDSTDTADTEESDGSPDVGEVWTYLGEECRITAVDKKNATVDLEPLDGGAPYEGVSWFDEDGNPQIEYVR